MTVIHYSEAIEQFYVLLPFIFYVGQSGLKKTEYYQKKVARVLTIKYTIIYNDYLELTQSVLLDKIQKSGPRRRNISKANI